MNAIRARLLPVLVLALMAMAMVGCQTDRLKEERDALYTQNRELQDLLNQRSAALEALEAENAALRSENASLTSQLASRSTAPVVPTTPTGNDPFAGIPGIETSRSASGSITVRVPGDVLFESGKVALRPSAQQTLARVASVIKRDYPNQTIRVEGYTDTDPIRKSSWKDNLELSLQRSASVHRYLASQGVSPKNMYAAGFGEHRPADSKSRSRRVEIVVVLAKD